MFQTRKWRPREGKWSNVQEVAEADPPLIPPCRPQLSWLVDTTPFVLEDIHFCVSLDVSERITFVLVNTFLAPTSDNVTLHLSEMWVRLRLDRRSCLRVNLLPFKLIAATSHEVPGWLFFTFFLFNSEHLLNQR